MIVVVAVAVTGVVAVIVVLLLRSRLIWLQNALFIFPISFFIQTNF